MKQTEMDCLDVGLVESTRPVLEKKGSIAQIAALFEKCTPDAKDNDLHHASTPNLGQLRKANSVAALKGLFEKEIQKHAEHQVQLQCRRGSLQQLPKRTLTTSSEATPCLFHIATGSSTSETDSASSKTCETISADMMEQQNIELVGEVSSEGTGTNHAVVKDTEENVQLKSYIRQVEEALEREVAADTYQLVAAAEDTGYEDEGRDDNIDEAENVDELLEEKRPSETEAVAGESNVSVHIFGDGSNTNASGVAKPERLPSMSAFAPLEDIEQHDLEEPATSASASPARPPRPPVWRNSGGGGSCIELFGNSRRPIVEDDLHEAPPRPRRASVGGQQAPPRPAVLPARYSATSLVGITPPRPPNPPTAYKPREFSYVLESVQEDDMVGNNNAEAPPADESEVIEQIPGKIEQPARTRELLIQHYETMRLSALNMAVLHRRRSAKAEAEQQARLAQLRLDVLRSDPSIQSLDEPINIRLLTFGLDQMELHISDEGNPWHDGQLVVELGIQLKFRGRSYLTNHREVSPRAQLCLFNFPTINESEVKPDELLEVVVVMRTRRRLDPLRLLGIKRHVAQDKVVGFGVVPVQNLDEAQPGQPIRELYFKRSTMRMRWVDPDGPLRNTFGVRGIMRTTIFTERLPGDEISVKSPVAIAPYAKKPLSPAIVGARGWELAERNKIFDVKA